MSINTSADTTKQGSPYLALGFALLAVSSSAILIRFAQRDANSLVIAAYRLLFATLILAGPAILKSREEISSLKKNQWLLIMLSGFFLAIHFGSWISSLAYTSIASSVVIVTSSPLWVAIFSTILLKERIPHTVRWGMGVAMIGALLVGSAQLFLTNVNLFGMNSSLWGQFLALVGAIFVAGYLIIGRHLRGSITLLPYTFLVYGFAAIFLFGFVLLLGLPVSGYKPQIWGLFLLMAIFPQLIGHSTYNWALKYISAVVVSIVALGEPIGATLLGFILLNESPHIMEIIGGVIIILGIFIASRKQ
ncbi:MAG: DMT family transporter [Anaerolineaceae bacterium]|nr:DMT family transporter [Anaerolineaceae bacterium]